MRLYFTIEPLKKLLVTLLAGGGDGRDIRAAGWDAQILTELPEDDEIKLAKIDCELVVGRLWL
jgi:hypothetical protein